MTIQITTLDIVCRFVAGLCFIGGMCLIFWDSRRWKKMNNKAHLRPKDYDSSGDIIPMSWKEEKGDLISREALKEDFKSRLALCNEWIAKAKDKETKIRAGAVKAYIAEVLMTIDKAPTVKEMTVAEKTLDSQWIPITFRQANEDEYKEFIERYDDIPREECKVYDCRMPDDGQEVLVTTCGGHVCEDIFCADPDYYGFENCSDPGDAIAWMPKPKAYKRGGDGE